jgi:hypothetical protein
MTADKIRMAAEDKIVEAAKKTIHENEAKWAYEI